MNRLIRSLLVLVLCTLCVAPVAAQAASSARQALEGSINKVLDTIKNPGYANPATRTALKRDIEAVLRTAFDFGEFSLRTVGPRWKEFSADQKTRFEDAFAGLLMHTYVDKIDGYNGEQVVYTGERLNDKGDRAEIQTVITMKDGKKIPVAYRMLPKNGAWHVYDVLVEGISLVKNYRTQFQEILGSATPDELIAKVQAKASEASAQGGK